MVDSFLAYQVISEQAHSDYGLIFAMLIYWPLFVIDRGQSLIIPPLFDGTNYAYWKVRMRAFLQSLDEKVWQAVEIGWTKPKEAPTD